MDEDEWSRPRNGPGDKFTELRRISEDESERDGCSAAVVVLVDSLCLPLYPAGNVEARLGG